MVTQIGLYDPAKESHEKVFVHDSDVEVTCCSINQERTFLGRKLIICRTPSGHSNSFTCHLLEAGNEPFWNNKKKFKNVTFLFILSFLESAD